MSSPEETNTGPVIRDLRRIDPATGQVKDPGQAQRGPGKNRPGKHAASRPGGTSGQGHRPGETAADGAPGAGAHRAGQPGEPGAPGSGAARTRNGGEAAPGAAAQPGQDLAAVLAERTADLQRITAEYANYRKRVERDRLAVREQALANVLSALLPVLDDIGRARQHEELTGGFKSVADSLEAIVTKLGLDSFGEVGEPFDPNVHEALLHSYSAEVSEPVCAQILQPGYRVGERILRPARVAVAEPGTAPAAETAPGTGEEPQAGTGPQEQTGAGTDPQAGTGTPTDTPSGNGTDARSSGPPEDRTGDH
jgi:molecular chaperone GrpE